MEREELGHWLRLAESPGVGNDGARRLLAAFSSPEAVFSQGPQALRQVATPSQMQGLLTEPPRWPTLLEASWRWLNERSDKTPKAERRILVLGDAAYPPSLLQMEDPPLLLYASGRFDAWAPYIASPALPPGLAIVGSRNPTPQGIANARELARGCVDAGWTVVSGLALGVDRAAHEGALDGAESRPGGQDALATVAVVGTGLDQVYPRANLALAQRIAGHGLILSEYSLGTPPLAANFPRRNRLIAGLSRGTLVVEAAPRSGSLITARLAAEQGKEVFAVPGSIHSMQSRGCHALIKQGAKLVESIQDVFDEFSPAEHVAAGAAAAHRAERKGGTDKSADDEIALGPDAAALLQHIAFDPVSFDALAARTGLDAARLQARLLELELGGSITRLPGGLFQRYAAG